jgi:hypothetical protein
MVEVIKAAENGDALSRLLQMQAARYDIRQTWTGRGTEDLISLMNAHAVKARLAKHLWTGLRELMQMPEMKTLPEALQAQMAAIVLKSQALTDLETEAHAKRLAAPAPQNVPTPTPTPNGMR